MPSPDLYLLSMNTEVIATLLGAVVGAVLALASNELTDWRRGRREAADQTEARKIRLWMFAYEAVELHRRWVLYASQANMTLLNKSGGLSSSRAYEWIPFSTVEEYLRVGGDKQVVQAVYRVKQLNSQVDIQVGRAQDAIRTKDANVQDQLGRIVAFVFAPDEWRPVCDEISKLLNLAEEAGNDVAALRRSFEEALREGEAARQSSTLLTM